jgi:hypothetical protein
MRRGRLAFDAADQRYTNSRLSLIVAARWQDDRSLRRPDDEGVQVPGQSAGGE